MKKLLCIIMSISILLMAGCSSQSEPVTTVPFDYETTTAGDLMGTVEGGRYISHAAGVAYNFSGEYDITWPDTSNKDMTLSEYPDSKISGPVIVWDNRENIIINYIINDAIKKEELNEETLAQMDSQSKYDIISSEIVDYKIGDNTYPAIKTQTDDVVALQIYVFKDNGLLILITIGAKSFHSADNIAKNIQLA